MMQASWASPTEQGISGRTGLGSSGGRQERWGSWGGRRERWGSGCSTGRARLEAWRRCCWDMQVGGRDRVAEDARELRRTCTRAGAGTCARPGQLLQGVPDRDPWARFFFFLVCGGKEKAF
ncbi:hypothetical protein RchiOBHm_Chr5g0019251 [Rosa chinensis]|uniref:Uncharacterized protein n=1 Tax=Rosa chinensis TaxID=74649 RepID=A0A2P6Q6Y8_ROSCH|nr:hypothetical protein RchiOBHm_Chr5g0019251 [Rosa chinensis]